MTRRALLRPFLLGFLSALGFVSAFALGSSGKALPHYLSGWRGWDDLAIASAYFRDASFPVGPYEIGNRYRRDSPEFRAFRQPLMKRFRDRPVTDAHVSIDPQELLGGRAYPVSRVDDSGRAFFLGAVFRATGAIRPLLLLWLPIALMAFSLAWLVFELSLRGLTMAAAATSVLISLSGFFREAAALGYAAYGFYFAAGIALMAFSVALSSGPSSGKAWPRLIAATIILGLTVPARNAVLLMAPAFLLAWMWRAWAPGSWKERAGALMLGLVLFGLAPQSVVWGIDRYSTATLAATGRATWPSSAAAGHDTWPTIWIGLGDFDRTKGHQYLDESARRLVQAAGFRDRLEPGAEAYLRDVILTEIADDPAWFAGIIGRRVAATYLLDKLWPSARGNGKSYALASHPNEGASDSYMELAPTADRFAWGRWEFEIPGFLLPLGWPLLALSRLRGNSHGESARLWRALVPSLLGFMTSPVIVTTGSGVEFQAVAAVHFLAWALAFDGLSRPRPEGRAGGKITDAPSGARA